jgi:hypothetical protein
MQKANEDKIIRLINAGVREVKGDRATPLTRALGTMLVAVCVAMASSSPAVRIRRHLMKRQLRSYCSTAIQRATSPFGFSFSEMDLLSRIRGEQASNRDTGCFRCDILHQFSMSGVAGCAQLTSFPPSTQRVGPTCLPLALDFTW